MASSGADNGERAGDDRSSKRQRRPPSHNENEESEEEYEEGFESSEDEDDFEDLVTDEQSESSKSSQSVKLQSSDVLDCPTCCEPLNRPIYQCSNGHLACSSCCKKMNKKCSFCRCLIGDIRCIAMEKVIEASIVPCPNAKYGCHETTMYGDQSSHKTLCDFARCFCPVPKCNYMSSYSDLKRHARAAHSWEEGILHSFVFDIPLIFSMNFGRRNMVIFQEEIDGDLVVVQAFKGSKGVYVTVNCIAPMAPGIRNLSCSLAKLSEFSTMRVGLRLDKIRKVSEQIKHEAADMLIPPKMLSGEHWKMEICIGRENKYTHI
ncbi:E3 ubiquitin-protein ligase SINA-like 5 [Cardamine amara subsp. amara]|uniref:RING-type E3 ubiquitin transferase n=1 Tax=Cardamine amara subsp. amara TaxID=228776 RepID=A0ABD0ZCF0_CARAN